MSPYKGDTLTFVDNERYPWGPAPWTTVLVFKYVYHIDINRERLISCSNRHNVHLKNILCRYFSPRSKVWQVVVASKFHGTICSSAIFKLFFVNTINKNSYCYTSSTHRIYIFTLNSDILSFLAKLLECII